MFTFQGGVGFKPMGASRRHYHSSWCGGDSHFGNITESVITLFKVIFCVAYLRKTKNYLPVTGDVERVTPKTQRDRGDLPAEDYYFTMNHERLQ